MTDFILFNLHEIIVRDDSTLLLIESFRFTGNEYTTWFLNIIQPFSEKEDLSILGPDSSFVMRCSGYVQLNWLEYERS